MSMIAESLDAEPVSVRTARHTVASALGDLLPPDELDGALLCTSEVVTNAVEHGAAPIELLVEAGRDCVRIEVRDGSPLRPRVLETSPTEVRGRGLLIVDRCSDRWGVEVLGEGKAVWFEFDVTNGHAGNEGTPPR